MSFPYSPARGILENVPGMSPSHQCSVGDRFGIYSQNAYLFQKNKSWPIVKYRAEWNPQSDFHLL